MNKFIFLLTFTLFFAVLQYACKNSTGGDNGSSSNKAECANPDAVNPNGSSELAVLMRKMTAFSENLKVAVQSDTLPAFPQDFNAIHTATPTDSTVHGDIFTGHAQLYLNALHKLYDDPKNDRKENFNNLVSSCVSCHENFCRGPIKRINKMKLS